MVPSQSPIPSRKYCGFSSYRLSWFGSECDEAQDDLQQNSSKTYVKRVLSSGTSLNVLVCPLLEITRKQICCCRILGLISLQKFARRLPDTPVRNGGMKHQDYHDGFQESSDAALESLAFQRESLLSFGVPSYGLYYRDNGVILGYYRDILGVM